MTGAEARQAWQAEHLLKTLWRVTHDQCSWTKVLGGHNPRRASYLGVFVPPLPELGIEAHELRLWRADLEALQRELAPYQWRELGDHLAKARWGQLYTFRRNRKRLERARVDEELLTVARLLVQTAKEVRRELQSH